MEFSLLLVSFSADSFICRSSKNVSYGS